MIPQCSRVRASASDSGVWISVEGQGAPGGVDFVEKKLVLPPVTTSPRQKAPKEDMFLPSFCPRKAQGTGYCWVSGPLLPPQEEISPLKLLPPDTAFP